MFNNCKLVNCYNDIDLIYNSPLIYSPRYNKTDRQRYISVKDIEKIQEESLVSGGEGLNFNKAKLIVQKYADKQLSERN